MLRKKTTMRQPTLCVGSPFVGGSGKTPLVVMLSQAISKENVPVAVFSKGYRRETARQNKVMEVLFDSFFDLKSASKTFGDEPCLIKSNMKSGSVWVGKDRLKSLQNLDSQLSALFIVDDGLQDFRINYQVRCATLKGDDLLKKSHLLPRGMLRESLSSLKECDYVFITDVKKGEKLDSAVAEVSRYTKAPVIGVSYSYECFEEFQGDQKRSQSWLEGKSLGMFCAISRPERFTQSLTKNLNINVVDQWVLADHERFCGKKLKDFCQTCIEKNASALVCTEKDIMKVSKNTKLALPIIYPKISPKIVYGQKAYNDLVSKCSELVEVNKRECTI